MGPAGPSGACSTSVFSQGSPGEHAGVRGPSGPPSALSPVYRWRRPDGTGISPSVKGCGDWGPPEVAPTSASSAILATSVVRVLTADPIVEMALLVLLLIFFFGGVVNMLRNVLLDRPVDSNKIVRAVVAYLMIGISGAVLYPLILSADPQRFCGLDGLEGMARRRTFSPLHGDLRGSGRTVLHRCRRRGTGRPVDQRSESRARGRRLRPGSEASISARLATACHENAVSVGYRASVESTVPWLALRAHARRVFHTPDSHRDGLG